MGWTCVTAGCAWKDESDSLNGVMRHSLTHPDHKVEPSLGTTMAWGRVLGPADFSLSGERGRGA